MNATEEARIELRELLDEVIPAGGAEGDTRFSDEQLNRLLAKSREINGAAAVGWKLKAVWAMSERGGLEESHAGDERHKFVSIIEYRDHCLAMARMYAEMSPNKGSRILSMCAPDVLGTGEISADISRILGVD